MTQPRPKLAPDALPLAVLMVALAVWFHPFLLGGRYLLPPNAMSAYPWYGTPAQAEAHPQGSMDAATESYIAWALVYRALHEGESLLWNPTILSGTPLLANQFAIPFSPYKLLMLFFSAPASWSWAIVLKSGLNACFTYFSARALGRSRTGGLIAALAWMASWALAHQTQTTYSEGVAYLPLLLYLCLQSWGADLPRRQAAYALLGAGVAGLQFLAGNIQMTVYSAAFLGGFACLWAWLYRGQAHGLSERWRPVWTLVAIYGGGVVVGALQLLSTAELLGLSIRGASQTHQNKGIEPYTALSFLNPWLYYWRNFEFPDLRVKYWLTYRWNPYIGILPLFLAGWGAFFSRERVARGLFILTGGVFALLHLLYWRPLFELAAQIPFYDALEQTRLLIMLPFPLALLAAYGWDALPSAGQKRGRLLLALYALTLPLYVGLLLAAEHYFDGERAWAARLPADFLGERTRVGVGLIADYYRLSNPLFAFTLALIPAACWLIWAGRRRTAPALGAIAVLLTGADVLFMASVNLASTPPAKVYPTTPALAFLQDQMQEAPFRLSAFPNTLAEGRPSGPYSTYQDNHTWFMSAHLGILPPNTAGLFGLQDIRGYESVYTLAYSRYLSALDGREGLFSAMVAPNQRTHHPMLDALNVRYLLAAPASADPNLDAGGLPLVYEGEIRIYENPSALPRASLFYSYKVLESDQAILDALASPTYDPRRDLYFPTPPHAVLEGQAPPTPPNVWEGQGGVWRVQTEAPAILVLSEIAYPGWRATVNESAAPIYTANTLFQAVFVPAGESEVRFVYRPWWLELGLALTFGGGGLVIVGAGGLLMRRLPSVQEPSAPIPPQAENLPPLPADAKRG